jgi:hypothetical protein
LAQTPAADVPGGTALLMFLAMVSHAPALQSNVSQVAESQSDGRQMVASQLDEEPWAELPHPTNTMNQKSGGIDRTGKL